MTIYEKIGLQKKLAVEAQKLKAEILNVLKQELLAALRAAPIQVENECQVTSFRMLGGDVYVTLRMPDALFRDS